MVFQWESYSDLGRVEGERVCFTQLWMCLVYLKEEGEEAYVSSAAPNCPRACHDSQTENRRGKKKKKKITLASVCRKKHTHTHTTVFLLRHNNTTHVSDGCC